MVTEESLVPERLILLRCLCCGNTAMPVWRCFWCPGSPEESEGSVMGFGSLEKEFVLLLPANSCEMTFFNP